jgi:competence protein ComEA
MVRQRSSPNNANQPDARCDGHPPHQEIAMFRSILAALLATASLAAFAAIDVNKATPAELQALPGVGSALSARVLAERQKAPFKNWADLIERVRGVGPGNAVKLSKAGLTVGTAEYKTAGK